MSAADEPARVYLRVEGNEEFLIGSFTLRVTHSFPGRPAVDVVDGDGPLAELLRKVADVIEADGDLPVSPD